MQWRVPSVSAYKVGPQIGSHLAGCNDQLLNLPYISLRREFTVKPIYKPNRGGQS
jgi:hypothetical protein